MPEAVRVFPSPVGDLILSATERALTGVYFPTSTHGPPPVVPHPPSPSPSGRGGTSTRMSFPLSGTERGSGGEDVLDRVELQLKEYFAGSRTTFDLPLDPQGTDFQRRVWELLRTIPYGVTTSYGEVARRLGDPRATRAVGAANGANPIPIIVPCHRVVGSNGSLTGFGGGIERKRWLLEHEGALLAVGDGKGR